MVSRWSHGGYDRRRLADLEVVSRWCSFAVVRGLRNKLRGGAGLRRSEPRSRGGAGLHRFLSLAVEICWSVVAGGGVLLKLWLDFVGLWWVLQWVKMWLRWLCCCEWWLAVLSVALIFEHNSEWAKIVFKTSQNTLGQLKLRVG